MFDDDLNVTLRSGGGARISTDAALFLSKQVVAAQREIIHQMRIEAADQARPETSRKEPEKPVENEKRDGEDVHADETPDDANEGASDGIQPLNITV